MARKKGRQEDLNQQMYYLQWHYGGDVPAHGRLSLSVIPAAKAQAAALRAALRRQQHPYTTLFHGAEQHCLRERVRIDALTQALREAGGADGEQPVED
jgi:hypothetical protein